MSSGGPRTPGTVSPGAYAPALDRIKSFGHSYVWGQGATTPDRALANLVAGALGAQLENYGIAGSAATFSAAGALTQVVQTISPPKGQPWTPAVRAALIYTGINDLGTTLVVNDLTLLTAPLRDMLLRCRAGGVIENSDTAFAYSQGGGASNWGTNNNSFNINSGSSNKQANSNGNTFTLTLPSDFPGGTLELHGVGTSGTGGTWAITVDGTAYGTWDTRNVGASGTYVPTYYAITGLAAGAHTIVGVVSNIGTSDFFDYAQIPAADPPLVMLCLINKARTYNNSQTHTIVDADVDTANTAIRAMLTTYFPNDPRIAVIDTDAVLNKSILLFGDAAGGGDQLHPNDAGHALLAQAIVAAAQAKMPPTSSLAKSRVPGREVVFSRRVPTAGQAPRGGTVTLVAGTATVSSRSITANTLVMLSRKTLGAAPGFLSYALTAAASTTTGTVTITSSSGTDTGVIAYELVEPFTGVGF